MWNEWQMNWNGPWEVVVISGFLGVSLLLYCIFAGADFGAGILEALMSITNPRSIERSQMTELQEVMSHAMGPVWEANHVWLILAIVILFNGFPKAYSELSIVYHIPLSLMLLGIVIRGCAFTFRHYDAVKDRSQIYYSWMYRIGSLLTPLMLGVIVGGIYLNRLNGFSQISFNSSYFSIYVKPWANGFCFLMGIFTCILFGFLAAVYLIGETENQVLKAKFSKSAKILNAAAILCGAFLFFVSGISGIPLFKEFISHPFSIASMTLATLILFPLWKFLRENHTHWTRILAAGQITFVLLGWIALQAPRLVGSWTIWSAAAPGATLYYLLYALIVGILLILPALAILLRIFKSPLKRP